MINMHRLDSAYAVADFEAHGSIRSRLLELIDESPAKPMINDTDRLNISKVDWNESKNFDRPWVEYLLPHLNPHISNVFKEMHFSKFKINEIWFQQYLGEASHGWHTHGSHFTNVYYLELDEFAPRTVLVNPFTREEFVPKVREGQTITFPSYVVHKSPHDFFDIRKTIISWNSDIDIDHPYAP